MAKKHHKMVNVVKVATVSAVVNWILGTACVLVLSPMLASFGALPGPELGATADHHMVVAVAIPFAFAAICFGLGALVAFLYNMFVKSLIDHPAPVRLDPEPEEEVGTAVGEVA